MIISGLQSIFCLYPEHELFKRFIGHVRVPDSHGKETILKNSEFTTLFVTDFAMYVQEIYTKKLKVLWIYQSKSKSHQDFTITEFYCTYQ